MRSSSRHLNQQTVQIEYYVWGRKHKNAQISALGERCLQMSGCQMTAGLTLRMGVPSSIPITLTMSVDAR